MEDIFLRQNISNQSKYCRITSAHKFTKRLGFKQYGVIVTKEESMLTKTMFSPEG